MISVNSEGVEEKELEDLRELIGGVRDDVDGIVVGGIASSYQGKRVKKICDDLDKNDQTHAWPYNCGQNSGRNIKG